MNTLRERFNLACPNCGQADSLTLDVAQLATLTATDLVLDGDAEWGCSTYCQIPACGYDGTIAGFEIVPDSGAT